jgi:UDP-glucose 4-epimerase
VFDKLEAPGTGLFYNLGTGTPNSVREIIDAVEAVTGLKVPVVEADRRAGDPPALYADSSKAQQELGWQIQYTNVKDIIATAWKWHQSHPNGFDEA